MTLPPPPPAARATLAPPSRPPHSRRPEPRATRELADARASIDESLAGPLERLQQAASGAREAGAALRRTASSERLAAVRAVDATGKHAALPAPPPKPARDPRRDPDD